MNETDILKNVWYLLRTIVLINLDHGQPTKNFQFFFYLRRFPFVFVDLDTLLNKRTTLISKCNQFKEILVSLKPSLKTSISIQILKTVADMYCDMILLRT